VPENYADTTLRNAAFAQVQELMATHDQLTSDDLRTGFQFEGELVPLINPQRGIFNPQRMQYLLSIRTVYPKAGGKIWYDDQRKSTSRYIVVTTPWNTRSWGRTLTLRTEWSRLSRLTTTSS
jgi:hypothetical protein